MALEYQDISSQGDMLGLHSSEAMKYVKGLKGLPEEKVLSLLQVAGNLIKFLPLLEKKRPDKYKADKKRRALKKFVSLGDKIFKLDRRFGCWWLDNREEVEGILSVVVSKGRKKDELFKVNVRLLYKTLLRSYDDDRKAKAITMNFLNKSYGAQCYEFESKDPVKRKNAFDSIGRILREGKLIIEKMMSIDEEFEVEKTKVFETISAGKKPKG